MSTKTSGLGSVIIIDDSGGTPRTISNDITNYSFSTPRNAQDVTGVDKSANERILLLADFSCTFNGVYNWATANMSHDVFKTVPSTSVNRTVSINPVGTTSTYPKLNNETLFTDYQVTRDNTGQLTWQCPGSLADGTVPAWSTN
jgi:hypothetical protein